MRGYGWRCDNCNLIEIVDLVQSFNQSPPQGWYVVYRDLGVARAEGVAPDREWHLCSTQCLDVWSLRRAGGRNG